MIGFQFIQDMQSEYIRLQENYLVIKQTFAGLRLTKWQIARLIVAQILRDTSPRMLIGISIALALFFIWVTRMVFFPSRSLKRLGIPLVGKSKGNKMDFRKMLEDAAIKVCYQSYQP